MIYLQFFADHEDYLAPLDDAERGRLFTGMVGYCFRGEEPELPGNERYVWPVFRRMIDQSRIALEKKQAGGRNRHSQRDGESPAADSGTLQSASTSQQSAAEHQHDPAPAQQEAAHASTRQQSAAKRRIKQETGIKNQESGIKSHESDSGESGGVSPPSPAKRTRFTPPTPAEVRAYCQEHGYTSVDADRFCDFYASKGWRVGNQPMKDWQASVRTWSTREASQTAFPPARGPKTVREQQYSQREYTNNLDALDDMMRRYAAEGGGSE